MRLTILIPVCLCATVSGAFADGILFAGADTEEFGQTATPLKDRYSRMTTSGATILTNTIVNTTYHVNGLTVVGVNDLLTGTVGSPATTALEGKTFNLVGFDGAVQTTTVSPGMPTTQFNEDMGFDAANGSVWRGHFGSTSTGHM